MQKIIIPSNFVLADIDEWNSIVLGHHFERIVHLFSVWSKVHLNNMIIDTVALQKVLSIFAERAVVLGEDHDCVVSDQTNNFLFHLILIVQRYLMPFKPRAGLIFVEKIIVCFVL